VIGARDACICLCRPCKEPIVCISLVCYDLRGKRHKCEAEIHNLDWSPSDVTGEICLGFSDGIKSDIDEAEGPVVDDILEDTGYETVDDLIADVDSCCDALVNVVAHGECNPTPEQIKCVGVADKLVGWFDDETLDDAVAIADDCPLDETPTPFEPFEVFLPIQEPHPGDGPGNPLIGYGLFERGPYLGVDGLWYQIIGRV